MSGSAVVRRGSPVFCQGTDAAVPWWSFTKTVIAAAALTLVRDGRLALDECLSEQPFTLRQLLRHQAGLTDYGYLSEYHAAVSRGDEPWTQVDMLTRADARRLRYPPGEGWSYSNIGYLYIRQLIEAETGLDLNAALHRLILIPLEVTRPRMVDTRAALRDAVGNLAGVSRDEAIHDYHPRWVYHGLLAGPLPDAAVLLDRLLTGTHLPAHLLQAMHESHPFPGPFPGRPWLMPGYGLGLMTGTVEGGSALAGHTGAGPGSVIAVYHSVTAGTTVATFATFATGDDQGVAERQAVQLLR
ncbi:MAG TPA: serine hydrolase domain-containing protein [Steroidobacteraceae bacterium]|nr:serine hydrolase domain-containing protein [Steroidobacteraceae bacterium]